ncbi:hypothetical protein LguiB_026744 [Lonicera macranthoides]
MFPLKREITAQEVLTRLGNLLVELGEHSHGGRPLPEDIDVLDALKELSQRGWPLRDRLGNLVEVELGNHSQGGGILAEPFDHQLRWLKIDLESVNLKIVEDLIVDARRIVYDAEQFFGSSNILNCSDQKKREVVIDMIRRYCRMVANYLPPDSCVLGLLYFLNNLYSLTDPIDDDVSSIFGHHLIDWIQGDQGSSTIASGGQVVGAAEGEDCFVGLDEQVDLLLPHLVNEGGAGKEMNNHLNKETCEELVRRCGGLPLAIVQLGELMQTEEWCSREALAAPEIIFNSVPMKGRVLEVMDLRLRKTVVVEDKEVITTMPSSSPIRRINKLAVYLGDLKDIDNYVPPKRGVAGELQSRKMQLAKLRNLETLKNFDLRVFNVEDLPHLNNLRKLGAIVTSKDDLGKIVKYLVYEASELLSHVAISIKYSREEPKGGVFIRGGPSGVETQPGKANGKIPTMESNTDDDTYVPDDEMDCIWQFGLAQSALLK